MKPNGAVKQIEIYRKMTGQERFRIGCELHKLARQIVTAGIRRMFPKLTPEQIEAKVNERMRNGAD